MIKIETGKIIEAKCPGRKVAYQWVEEGSGRRFSRETKLYAKWNQNHQAKTLSDPLSGLSTFPRFPEVEAESRDLTAFPYDLRRPVRPRRVIAKIE